MPGDKMTSVIDYDTLPFPSLCPDLALLLKLAPLVCAAFFFFLQHSFSALVGTLTESLGHHVQISIYSCAQGVSKNRASVRVVAVDTLGVPLATLSFLEVLVRTCSCVYGYGYGCLCA